MNYDYNEGMDTPEKSSQPSPARAGGRGVETRQKLLDAAVDIFGRQGFDSVTTRMLASAAGVNLQAIPYYFGGKEGLYLAVAEQIAGPIKAQVTPVIAQIRTRLADADERQDLAMQQHEARFLLCQLLETFAGILLSEVSAPWVQFVVREQMAPTAAFDRLYDNLMQPLLGIVRILLGHILGTDPDAAGVRIRALGLIGQIIVFRVANAAVLRQLDWQEIGANELSAIQAFIRETVAGIATGPLTDRTP